MDGEAAAHGQRNPRGGPPVVDVGPANIGLYAQGSFLLVQRDLEEALPAAAVAEILGCEARPEDLAGFSSGDASPTATVASIRAPWPPPLVELERAYRLRRNVVSLKKVAQHVLLAAEQLEDDLARGCTWHFKNTAPILQLIGVSGGGGNIGSGSGGSGGGGSVGSGSGGPDGGGSVGIGSGGSGGGGCVGSASGGSGGGGGSIGSGSGGSGGGGESNITGSGGGGYAHHPTYALLAGQYAAARGAVCAVQDLRTATKALACVPRYCGSSSSSGDAGRRLQLSPLLRGDFRPLRTAALLRALERRLSAVRDGAVRDGGGLPKSESAEVEDETLQYTSDALLAPPGGEGASAADADVAFQRALYAILGPLEEEAAAKGDGDCAAVNDTAGDGGDKDGSNDGDGGGGGSNATGGTKRTERLRHWRACGPEAAALLRCSVIARGGAKALLMRVLLARLAVGLEQRLLPAIDAALDKLHSAQDSDATAASAVVAAPASAAAAGDTNSSSSPNNNNSAGRAHLDRATRELEACRATWLDALSALHLVVARGADTTLFAAADGPRASLSHSGISQSTAALVVPRGFALGDAALKPCRVVAARFNASVRSAIAAHGWPPVRAPQPPPPEGDGDGANDAAAAAAVTAGASVHAGSGAGLGDVAPFLLPPAFPSLAGAHPCARCGLKLAKLWLQRGSSVCLRCDEEWRHGVRLGSNNPSGSLDSSTRSSGGGSSNNSSSGHGGSSSGSGSDSSTGNCSKVSEVCSRDARPPLVLGGSCPLATRACMPAAWCQHAHKCFACEPHSCPLPPASDYEGGGDDCDPRDDSWSGRGRLIRDACGTSGCGLVRGDGAEVAALAEDLKACVVFLDFDRTLASTRRGQSPYPDTPTSKKKPKPTPAAAATATAAAVQSTAATAIATTATLTVPPETLAAPDAFAAPKEVFSSRRYSPHTVDEDLRSLCSWHPNVHVVTRNRHTQDIVSFLRNQGCCVRRVWHVAKGASKATVVLNAANWHLPPTPTPTPPPTPPLPPPTSGLSTVALEFRAQGADGQASSVVARAERPVVLFVDDDVREHLDPLFLAAACLAASCQQHRPAAAQPGRSDSGGSTDAASESREPPSFDARPLLYRLLFSRALPQSSFE